MQTADHDWPFMSLLSDLGAPPAFHLTQVSHRNRSIAQLSIYGTPSRPVSTPERITSIGTRISAHGFQTKAVGITNCNAKRPPRPNFDRSLGII